MLEQSLWIFIIVLLNVGLLPSIFMIVKGSISRLKNEYFDSGMFGNLFFALFLLGVDFFASAGMIMYVILDKS